MSVKLVKPSFKVLTQTLDLWSNVKTKYYIIFLFLENCFFYNIYYSDLLEWVIGDLSEAYWKPIGYLLDTFWRPNSNLLETTLRIIGDLMETFKWPIGCLSETYWITIRDLIGTYWKPIKKLSKLGSCHITNRSRDPEPW